jgi:hydroxymethylpyrimidine/phosphomethylpyrimidine kinase
LGIFKYFLSVFQKNKRFPMNQSPPVTLTIAGSDCSAGAGLQADLKTFGALGTFGLTAVTSVVSEVPGHVESVKIMPTSLVAGQIKLLCRTYPVAAAKTGMLPNASLIRAIASIWKTQAKGIPLVIDPVMVASSGDPLVSPEAIRAMQKDLFPHATLITPNLEEASLLWAQTIQTVSDMERAAADLADKFKINVLVKGGHLGGPEAVDILHDGTSATFFRAPRLPVTETHGTGCTYSAAITAGLGHGLPLAKAVEKAKEFITLAIRHHHTWKKPGASTSAVHALCQTITP